MKKIFLLVMLIVLPVGFSVAHASSALIDIPEKYATVSPGDRLYFNLEILYPENNHRQDLRITYTVRRGDATVATQEILKAVETQASFTDYVTIPSGELEGTHTIEAEIESYDGSFQKHVSASFQVKAPTNLLALYFYILLGAIVLVGVILFIEVYHEGHLKRLR